MAKYILEFKKQNGLTQRKDVLEGLTNHVYTLSISSDTGHPLPQGLVYIFLEKSFTSLEAVTRCSKHSGMNDAKSVIKCHSLTTKASCLVIPDTGCLTFGFIWRLVNDGSTTQNCEVSFTCSNFEVSKKRNNSRWILRGIGLEDLEHCRIQMTPNYITILKHERYMRKRKQRSRKTTPPDNSPKMTITRSIQTDPWIPTSPSIHNTRNILSSIQTLTNDLESMVSNLRTIQQQLQLSMPLSLPPLTIDTGSSYFSDAFQYPAGLLKISKTDQSQQ